MTYYCSACGQEWDEHPFLQLPCPLCGAEAGAWCKRPSGHSGPFVDIHIAREQAVLDAGLIEVCPAGAHDGRNQKKQKYQKSGGQLALPI